MFRIYAIYDIAAETIRGGLQLYKHDAAAIRAFTDVASDPETQIARHTNDFELLYLGTVDEETGYITVDKEVILTGKQWAAVHKTLAKDNNIQEDIKSVLQQAQKATP